ncbi:MAG: Uma2 family endonuclease [Fimbriiglobus sp.]
MTTTTQLHEFKADFVGIHRFATEDFLKLKELGFLEADGDFEWSDGFVLDQASHEMPNLYFPQWQGLHRWSLSEYQRMTSLGLLGANDKLELLDGFLVRKMPQNSPHSSTLFRVTEDIRGLLPAGWLARCQLPLEISGSAPEPDLAVVRGNRRSFDDQHPQAPDVGLIVEVSDASLVIDRGFKRDLYSSADIPYYWVVNLQDQQVEVYFDPTPQGYATSHIYRVGDEVPVMLGGAEVGRLRVVDLLP